MIPIEYLTDEDEEADEDDEDSKIYLSERVVKLAEYHIRSL